METNNTQTVNSPDRMKLESPNLHEQNVETLRKIFVATFQDKFPSCITETRAPDGSLRQTINFEVLREILVGETSDSEERYEFTWVGKRQARSEAYHSTNMTLRPCKDESVDWDTTPNLYIEGDNLEVLKLLYDSYLGKVKMIYIDPPYNTGHDFVYRDNFHQTQEKYARISGQTDEEGNQLYTQNNATNPRFHSDWCSMIYSRLLLARNLLTDDGVIFISIDDNEVENLKKICAEIFGSKNFVAQLIWERAYAPKNDAKFVSNSHDYVLMFVKSIDHFTIGRLPRTEEANARYANPDNDPRGVWKPSDISVKTYNAENDYSITAPSGRVIEPPAGRCWSLSKNAFLERLHDNRIWFGPDGNSVPSMKRFLSELKFDGLAPTSIMFYKDVGHSQEGSQEVTKLLESGAFDGPKPVRLLTRLLTLANLKEDSIVLDFFSGSGTTAHAVMKYNCEQKSHVQFIMVQLQEECKEGGTAYKAGYKNVCEIGKERIRRAGKQLRSKPVGTNEYFDNINPDVGFRVFKLDDTNYEDVFNSPSETSQKTISDAVLNLKSDRSDLDLLFGCVLAWGLPLSLPYKETKAGDAKILVYNDGDLIACFEQELSEKTIIEIANLHPLRAVFRDSCFKDGQAKVNLMAIFKRFSPDTKVKTL